MRSASYVVLVARLRALLRRGRQERPAVLEVGDLKLDPATHRVWRADQEVAYKLVAQTLADASKAGLSKVGFISEPER